MPARRYRAYLYLILVTILWGAAAPIFKIGLEGTSTATLLTYRFGLTTLILIPLFSIFKHKLRFPQKKSEWWPVILHGFLRISIALLLTALAIKRTTALEASFIHAMAPIFTTIIAIILLHEHLTNRKAVGIIIAFVGTILAIVSPSLLTDTISLHGLTGNLLMVAANIVTAFSIVYSKIGLRHHISPFLIAGISFFIGFITILPFGIMENGSLSQLLQAIFHAPLKVHLSTLYMVIFGGLLAHTLHESALSLIKATEATVFTYLQPIITAPLALIWLGESISQYFLIGAAIVVVGVFFAEFTGIFPKRQLITAISSHHT